VTTPQSRFARQLVLQLRTGYRPQHLWWDLSPTLAYKQPTGLFAERLSLTRGA